MRTKIPVPAGLIINTGHVSHQSIIPSKKLKKIKDDAKSKRGKMSRTKGHGFEREVARMLRENGYPQARRHLEYQEGAGIDIEGAGVYDIQCKRGRKYASCTVLEAEIPKTEGRVQVLITRADKEIALAVMPLSHFLEIMKK